MAVSNPSETLRTRARATLDRLRGELLDERADDGHWVGCLSPSSLSTATAVSAMSAVLLGQSSHPDSERLARHIGLGLEYLAHHQNADGGFGDTDRSHSNIATSYLVLAASTLTQKCLGRSLESSQVERLKRYLIASGELEGLRRRYGKDKTFVVPILTNMAIAGLVDWSEVSALPFEAAVFPQSMYRFLGMPVVSYAIPALVAIGQARHFHGPRVWFPLRQIRAAAIGPSLAVLGRMQPESGGYLEATPLTAFVVMSLAATGRGDCEVSRHGLRFLSESMTAEGSWPIDTNLATWVTSLAIHALACDPSDDGSWCRESLVEWHLGCQHLRRHPFTGARPGGWGWSDLSGAVPDSDDTPAAILALVQMRRWIDQGSIARIDQAISRGKNWLLKLQNRNGGWPTFCRGWGKLPFDRSSTDLTAHALRALHGQGGGADAGASSGVTSNVARATRRAVEFLRDQQHADGSWNPLWFGNQDREDESNPLYGTSRVLLAADLVGLSKNSRDRAREFLLGSQNGDGGWGGGPSVARWLETSGLDGAPRGERADDVASGVVVSSIEETAVAVDALATLFLGQRNSSPSAGVELGRENRQNADSSPIQIAESWPILTGSGKDACQVAIIRGVEFLLGSVDDGRHRVPWPIGFYFAKLWYHERLYPLIFAVTALGKYLRATTDRGDADWPP
jgi:squalene-hopene/tetraprenyl-beta-curcumene cyclase